jgi:hypothetical protein
LLRQERVSQVSGPLNVSIQQIQGIGKCDQRLNAWVPILLPGRIYQLLATKIAVLLEPPLRLNDFQRVGACGQDLPEQWIRV